MSDQYNMQESEDLSALNAQLTESLERCRSLLRDCESKLSANSNRPLTNDNRNLEDEEAVS